MGEKANCKAGMVFMKALPRCEEQSLLGKKRKKTLDHGAQVTLAHVNSQPLKNHGRIFEKRLYTSFAPSLSLFFFFLPDHMNTFDLFWTLYSHGGLESGLI